MKKILGFIVFCLFIYGCSAFTYHHLNYEITLDEVERPSKAEERYGEQKIFKSEDEEFDYVFEDQMIKISWLPTSSVIGFRLKNKTEHTIRLIWDEAAYVDEGGETHRVIHSGVKYTDKNSPLPPSVVVRNGTLSEIVYPSDYIYYSDGWQEKPLLVNTQVGGEPNELLNRAKENVGKKVQILLPIQIEDTVNDYIFTFRVKDVQLKE